MQNYQNNNGQFIKGNPPPKHKQACKCFRCSGVAWNKGIPMAEVTKKKQSELRKGIPKPEHRGQKHPSWLGDRVGYSGLHHWLNKRKTKPILCESCGKSKKLVWANKSYEYTRNLNDWIALCQKCHMERDSKEGWGIALKRFPDLKRYYENRKSKSRVD